MSQKQPDNGIVNPNGLLVGGAAVAFLAAVPVTSYITAPGGVLQSFVEAAVRLVPGTANIPTDRVLPALSALYIFVTFGATGAFSAAGQSMASEKGLDDNHPRQNVNNLRGLPLRMRSAHYNLMEMFPGFALAAGLTQALAPGNQQLINLLGLHVLAKCFVYYPMYLLNIPTPRTMSHVLATASIINVCWQLATGAK